MALSETKSLAWAGQESHACNPRYSGGRDEEDGCLKPAGAQKERPYLKNAQHKKGLVEWLNDKSTSLASMRPW
jgi:hypothetical protein